MRTTIRNRLLKPLAPVLAAALLAGCGGDDGPSTDEQGVTTAKIGLLPIVEVAPVYLGMEQGFYEEEGIRLEPELAQGGAAVVPAVVSGQYEFGFSNVVSLLLAQNEGLQISMLTPSSKTTGEVGNDISAVVVLEESPIQSPADLEGRTVSVNTQQNIGDVTIKAAMENHGADGSKIRFSEMPLPNMQSQLEQGRIDAAWVVEPFLSALLDSGARPVLWNFAETDPNLIIAAYFTSKKLRAESPDLVDGFLRATTRSMEYARDNPAEVARILTTYTELTPEQAESLVLPRYDAELDRAVMQHVAELMQKYGLTSEVPDVAGLIDEE